MSLWRHPRLPESEPGQSSGRIARFDRFGRRRDRSRAVYRSQINDTGDFAPKAAIATGTGRYPISEPRSVVRARLRELPLIYMLILGIGITALVGSSALVTRQIGRGRILTIATEVANQRLEKLRLLSRPVSGGNPCAQAGFASSANPDTMLDAIATATAIGVKVSIVPRILEVVGAGRMVGSWGAATF